MNLVGWLVLIFLAADYLLGLAATILNLRTLDPALPDAFRDIYDEEEYHRSQEYTRAKSRLGLVSDTAGLLILLIFWFAGGFEFVDQWARGFGLGPVVTGVIFLFTLLLAQSIIGIPASIYSTFVLERRFGFNRTTPATFVLDRVKGLVLGVIIGGPLLALVLAFFIHAGPLAWLYCWIAVVTVTLVIQYVAPTWIMPLFNKFEPLDDGELKDTVLRYADSAGFPLKNVFRMDGSKRSSKANAFFTGFGRNKRVVLFDTLIEQHTTDEIVSIVAHEVGHYRKGHIKQGVAISILHSGLMLFLLSLVLTSPALFEAFFVSQPSVHAGLVFFGLLFSPVETVVSIALNALSRRNEFEADEFAMSTTESSEALSTALKKLSSTNLSNLTPHPFYVRLYYSHPPLKERVRAMKRAIQNDIK